LIIVHISDLHLVPEAFQKTPLEEAYYGVLREIVDLVLENKIKYLIIAGDLFNYYHEPLDVLVKSIIELKRLREAGVRVVVVPGNHDFAYPRKSVLDLLHGAGLIHLLSSTVEMNWLILEPLIFEDDKLAFYGIPGFRGASNKEIEYLKMHRVKFKGADKLTGYNITILAHLNTKFQGYDPSRYTRRYGALYMEYEDFFNKLPGNTRYVALGHIHLPIPIGNSFRARMAYPGAPIGVDIADLKETIELEKIGGYRRVLIVDLSEEPPLVRSVKLESTPKVYYGLIEAKSVEEVKAEVKRLLDNVDPDRISVVIVEVRGTEVSGIEGAIQELIKAYGRKKVYARIKPAEVGLEEELYAPAIEIVAETKGVSIEEIELKVIKEYLAKRKLNVPPEKIQWLINYLGQNIGSNVEKALKEIIEELEA